jgi:hypothetical protein
MHRIPRDKKLKERLQLFPDQLEGFPLLQAHVSPTRLMRSDRQGKGSAKKTNEFSSHMQWPDVTIGLGMKYK